MCWACLFCFAFLLLLFLSLVFRFVSRFRLLVHWLSSGSSFGFGYLVHRFLLLSWFALVRSRFFLVVFGRRPVFPPLRPRASPSFPSSSHWSPMESLLSRPSFSFDMLSLPRYSLSSMFPVSFLSNPGPSLLVALWSSGFLPFFVVFFSLVPLAISLSTSDWSFVYTIAFEFSCFSNPSVPFLSFIPNLSDILVTRFSRPLPGSLRSQRSIDSSVFCLGNRGKPPYSPYFTTYRVVKSGSATSTWCHLSIVSSQPLLRSLRRVGRPECLGRNLYVAVVAVFVVILAIHDVHRGKLYSTPPRSLSHARPSRHRQSIR
ncbi:hypothetical protein GGR52DRAFT_331232 [Hypoxylon sp. FL1284]|nr:hypothetical protein GGR52DRAFT_331232 [Hypoxylon sp. FL1284]